MTRDEHLKDSLKYWQDAYRHCELRASRIAAVAGALAALFGKLLLDFAMETGIESIWSTAGIGITVAFLGICAFVVAAVVSIRSIQPISLGGKPGIPIHKEREALESKALAELETVGPEEIETTLRSQGEQIYWCDPHVGDTAETYYTRSMATAIIKFRTFTSIRARIISRSIQALVTGACFIAGSLFMLVILPITQHNSGAIEVEIPVDAPEIPPPFLHTKPDGTSH